MDIEAKIKYIAKVMNHKSYITFHRSRSETRTRRNRQKRKLVRLVRSR